MLKKAEILTFGIEPSNNMPLIILKECNGERTLPIPAGTAEANSIALKTLGISSDRPLTIDLTIDIVEKMRGTIEKVVIDDLSNNVFYAKLHITMAKGAVVIDCRPSDALSLAIRAECPIFIDEGVFDKAENGKILSDGEKIRKTISETATLDFGRYYLK